MAISDESDYESDPEELKRSLATRRREASDDDDDSDNDNNNEEVKNRRDEIDSESDQSDEQVDDSNVKYDDNDEISQDGEVSFAVENAIDDGKRKEGGDGDGDGEEGKDKQSVVPTGGAFYMHDDRFQEMSGGRSRRGRGGRRFGEERKWGHDKFEEIDTPERHYDRNSSRGRFRGRGRGKGQERGGYASRGSSSNASSSSGQQQVYVPKPVTRGGGGGRGPRRDNNQRSKENQTQWVQRKPRSPTAPAKTGNEGAAAYTKKNVAVASSLSSASPPFYPSTSSSNLVHGVQVGMERLNMNETSGKKYSQSFKPTGAPAARNTFRPQSHSQGESFSSANELNGGSKGSVQGRISPSSQGFDQRTLIRPLSSSASSEASFAKGKGTILPSGSGSFMYNGAQMMGRAESMASGDFPAYLPVMQFGGQHGGGVPRYGMAYPGYVEDENGVRNPEMTWMPVLTGPGALGASYSPPNAAAINGSYQAQQPGRPSSAGFRE